MLTLVLVAVSAFARPPAAGELVISEVMPAPLSQSTREWIEVYNATTEALELDGCRVIEGHLEADVWAGEAHVVSALQVQPASYALLHRSVAAGECAAFSDSTGTTCIATIDYQVTSLSFLNDEAETVCVVCGDDGIDQANPCADMGVGETLIDAAPVNFPAFMDDCPITNGAGDGRNCSIALTNLYLDAAANDDESNWCIGDAVYYDTVPEEAHGTPRAANAVCPPPDTGTDDTGVDDTATDDSGEPTGPACAAGQVIFTELMPAPRDSGNADEWLELWGVDTALSGTCSLNACELVQRETDGVEIKRLVLGDVGVTSGAHTIIARASAADVDTGIRFENGALVTHANYLYGYNDFNLPNDREVVMSLECGGAEIDAIAYDWSEWAATAALVCPWDDTQGQEGCSLNLGRHVYSAASNDLDSNWCLAQTPEDQPDKNFWTRYDSGSTHYVLLGTPGQDGDCPNYTRACVGEIVFTEVMASGQEIPDWLEVYNVTTGDLELSGCRLERYRLDGDTEVDIQDYTFGELGESPVVLAERPLAISLDGCIDPAADPADGCTFGETVADGITLTADNTEYLRLICPPDPDCGGENEILVDVMHYSMDAQLVDDGHSLMFDPRLHTDPATANDDTANWCESAWSQPFLQLDAENCNYGTPGGDENGGPGECLTDAIDIGSPGPACRCQSGGAALVGWLFGALALASRRRRA